MSTDLLLQHYPVLHRRFARLTSPHSIALLATNANRIIIDHLSSEPYILLHGTNDYTDRTAHYHGLLLPEIEPVMILGTYGASYNPYNANHPGVDPRIHKWYQDLNHFRHDYFQTAMKYSEHHPEADVDGWRVNKGLLWGAIDTGLATWFSVNTKYRVYKMDNGMILLRHVNYRHMKNTMTYANPWFCRAITADMLDGLFG